MLLLHTSLICKGPSKRKEVAFRGKSAKADAMDPLIEGSAGSGVEVGVYEMFGYTINSSSQ